MPTAPSLLMIQFLDWVASRPRTYAEIREAWRTSCPRLTVWEDALMVGYIQVQPWWHLRESQVTLTELGRTILTEQVP